MPEKCFLSRCVKKIFWRKCFFYLNTFPVGLKLLVSVCSEKELRRLYVMRHFAIKQGI